MDSKVNTAKADREDIFSQNCEFELPLVFAAAHGDVAWVRVFESLIAVRQV